jgi:23S rRNA (cytosine1962-C5)-methyltransferase
MRRTPAGKSAMPKKSLANGAPVINVSSRGARRLRDGHVWVYRSDVLSSDEAAPGALVRVVDERGGLLGTALYSSASQIAIRMISKELVEDFGAPLRERIRAAIVYRESIVSDSNAYRLIFSEADFLPGLIVDRYNDLLSFQVLTQAMDADPVRETFISELKNTLTPAAIIERVDPKIRQLEELPARSSAVLVGEKSNTIFTMNGVQFHYDGLQGQKTGAFLDQRENYAAAAQYARGEALDVFCYQGGFAIHLARCSKVTGVDRSRPALEVAERNAGLNNREIEWIEANAFDLLRDYSDEGREFDTIILDPPAFARNKRSVDTALRAYKELNLRALRMLHPGGILVTCSCSYHVSPSDFLEAVLAAAHDSHRKLRLVENRAQAKDHPILLNIPETAYLKCLIINASN